MGTDINETGMQGQKMKQGEEGQTEGCQRCVGNRMNLRTGKVQWRRGSMGQTLSEIYW